MTFFTGHLCLKFGKFASLTSKVKGIYQDKFILFINLKLKQIIGLTIVKSYINLIGSLF